MEKKNANKSGFTDEEIDELKNMMYQTNAGGMAINPPSPTWYNSVEKVRQSKISNAMKEIEVKIIKDGKQIYSVKTTEQRYREAIIDGARRIACNHLPCHLELYVNGELEERLMFDYK